MSKYIKYSYRINEIISCYEAYPNLIRPRLSVQMAVSIAKMMGARLLEGAHIARVCECLFYEFDWCPIALLNRLKVWVAIVSFKNQGE